MEENVLPCIQFCTFFNNALYTYTTCSKHTSKQTKQMNTYVELHTSRIFLLHISPSFCSFYFYCSIVKNGYLVSNQLHFLLKCYQNKSFYFQSLFFSCSLFLCIFHYIFLKLFYSTSIFRWLTAD